MKNYLIYVISTIFLSLLVVFVLVIPNYQELNEINEKVFAQQVALQSQKDYFEELQNTADRLEGTESTFEKIDSALPEGHNLANLMNYFQKSASKSGVTMKNISPALVASTKSKEIKASKVNLVLNGDYPSFKKFLSIIEKSSRLIEVESINFTTPEEEIFTFNISTKVYYR
jgi:Tfp pilus assembly protein PilO